MDRFTREAIREFETTPNRETAERAVSRMARAFPRKVIIHASYGGGFSTRIAGETSVNVAEWQPLIAALEANEDLWVSRAPKSPEAPYGWVGHPAIVSLIHAVYGASDRPEKDTYWTVNALVDAITDRSLVVRVATGPYKIREYDGKESVEVLDLNRWTW